MFMDKQWGKASRKDIDNVLREKLQEGLHESEKTNRITYLITSLRRANVIRNIGSRTKSEWVLCADIEVQKEI
jgi:ATP-dependent DNA helicase RecG